MSNLSSAIRTISSIHGAPYIEYIDALLANENVRGKMPLSILVRLPPGPVREPDTDKNRRTINYSLLRTVDSLWDVVKSGYAKDADTMLRKIAVKYDHISHLVRPETQSQVESIALEIDESLGNIGEGREKKDKAGFIYDSMVLIFNSIDEMMNRGDLTNAQTFLVDTMKNITKQKEFLSESQYQDLLGRYNAAAERYMAETYADTAQQEYEYDEYSPEEFTTKYGNRVLIYPVGMTTSELFSMFSKQQLKALQDAIETRGRIAKTKQEAGVFTVGRSKYFYYVDSSGLERASKLVRGGEKADQDVLYSSDRKNISRIEIYPR